MFNFGPVIESPCSKDAFLTESVEMAYKNKNVSYVPVLMGLVHDEGDYMASCEFKVSIKLFHMIEMFE